MGMNNKIFACFKCHLYFTHEDYAVVNNEKCPVCSAKLVALTPVQISCDTCSHIARRITESPCNHCFAKEDYEFWVPN